VGARRKARVLDVTLGWKESLVQKYWLFPWGQEKDKGIRILYGGGQ